jgi:hypothetical protein
MKTRLNVTMILLFSLVLMLLAACADPAVVEPTAEPVATETAEAVDPVEEQEEQEESDMDETEREETTVIIPDDLEDLVDEMIDDLSDRAQVSREAVVVTEVRAVTWRDGSLGCPEPGMSYTMALEPGYQVILTVDGKEFYYHTRGNINFIYCEDPAEDGTLPDM